MTEKLFHDDPYLKNCEAEIRAVLHLDSFQPPRTGLVLDRSMFYPEGGGQPGDRGSFAGAVIIDTRKAEELEITLPDGVDGHDPVHIVELNSQLKAGTRGVLELDWKYRWDYMQQHSGQHLLSAAFYHIGNYPTISVHQGEEFTTIEFEAGDIPDADIVKAENMANAAILADLPLTSRLVDEKQLASISLRRSLKTTTDVRILEIGGKKTFAGGFTFPEHFDAVGCGGVHVTRSGEVRVIRHIKTERIRGRVRLYWKIGDRALADYRLKSDIIGEMGVHLSRQPEELLQRITQIEDEMMEWRRKYLETRREVIFASLDRQLENSSASAPAILHLETSESRMIKDAVKRIQKSGYEKALLTACESAEDTDGKLNWVILDSSSNPVDFARIKADVLDPRGARGGGKAPMWQGSMEAGDESAARELAELLMPYFE